MCIALEPGSQSQNGVPGTEGQGQRQVSKVGHQASVLEVGVRVQRAQRGALHLDVGSAHCQLLSTLGIGCSKGLAMDLAAGQSGHGDHTGQMERSPDSSWRRPGCRLEVRLLAGPRPRGWQGGEDLTDQCARCRLSPRPCENLEAEGSPGPLWVWLAAGTSQLPGGLTLSPRLAF